MPAPPDAPDPRVERLRTASMQIIGRFASASNATLLVSLADQEGRSPSLPTTGDGDLDLPALDPEAFAVYKPQAGEAPLWDFPDGTLYRREVAAFEVDRLLGWDLVPTTVIREEAPHGPGALQRFVPHDPDEHYFALLEVADPDVVRQLQRMVLLDLVIDNADRKGSHVLLEGARIRVVDHGVSFHVEPKLRTVAWDFAGQPVADADRADLAGLLAVLRANDRRVGALRSLLAPEEVDRLLERTAAVAEMRRFPEPSGHRPYPWPLL